MNVSRSISGVLQLQLTAADPATAMSDLRNAGITVLLAHRLDTDITIHLTIHRQDYLSLKALAERKGYGLQLNRRAGYYWRLKSLIQRPVLVFGMAFLLFLTFFVPSRVLLIKVEGNTRVPTKLILENCRNHGIIFGCSRRQIRSEQLKNALLEQIPQLEWAGINTAGCVATITVSERPESTEQAEKTSGISSIIAIRDAIITECTVTSGKALCKVGQAVKKGQMLVSGYTDCGISIRAESARAEVYGQTERHFSGIIDRKWRKTTAIGNEIQKYAVIIGKKRINFYKDSGIPTHECDRIYTQVPLTLPGGFTLPVWLVTETWIQYESAEHDLSEETGQQSLQKYSSIYLKSQMNAGQIMSRMDRFIATADAICLKGDFYCHEMIGQIKYEEILPPYGKYG